MLGERWLHDIARIVTRRIKWWALWGLIGTMLLLLADGRFRTLGQGTLGLLAGVCFVALCGLLTHRMWPGRIKLSLSELPDAQLATGAAQLVLGYALAQWLAGLWGEAAVIRYALVAAVLGFHRGLRLLGLSVLALLCEGLFRYATGQHTPSELFGSLVLLGLFMGLREAVFRGELLRQQIEHKRRVADAIDDLSRQAELFRLNLTETSLVATTTEWTEHGSRKTAEHIDRSDAERLILRSAVVMVRQNLDALVGLLRQALGLTTCAVLWQNSDDSKLEVVAASTDSPLMLLRQVPSSAGLLGTVKKTRSLLSLTAPKLAQLAYYDRPDSVAEGEGIRCAAALVLPLFEEGALCGALCVDRIARDGAPSHPFAHHDEEALRAAVPIILRSIQSERVFRSVEQGRDASQSLAYASGLLSAALRPEEVAESALSAVAKLCPFDFAALTEYDDKQRQHQVLSVSGDASLGGPLKALRFADNAEGSGPAAWRILVMRRTPREQFSADTSALVPRDAPSSIATLQPLQGVVLPAHAQFLSLRPSLTWRTQRERSGDEPVRSQQHLDLALDLKWRPRPELVVDGTLHPDFSQVALDVPQLAGNSRFALFFPEKRPFFFESSDLLRSPTEALYTRSLTAPRWGLRSTWRGGRVAGTAMALGFSHLGEFSAAYRRRFGETPSQTLARRG